MSALAQFKLGPNGVQMPPPIIVGGFACFEWPEVVLGQASSCSVETTGTATTTTIVQNDGSVCQITFDSAISTGDMVLTSIVTSPATGQVTYVIANGSPVTFDLKSMFPLGPCDDGQEQLVCNPGGGLGRVKKRPCNPATGSASIDDSDFTTTNGIRTFAGTPPTIDTAFSVNYLQAEFTGDISADDLDAWVAKIPKADAKEDDAIHVFKTGNAVVEINHPRITPNPPGWPKQLGHTLCLKCVAGAWEIQLV